MLDGGAIRIHAAIHAPRKLRLGVLHSAAREVCKGQGLYVTGRSTDSEPSALLAPWRTNELSEDVKFTELVADILGAMRQTQSAFNTAKAS